MWRPSIRGSLTAAILLIGCSTDHTRELEQLWQRARSELQAGELPEARKAAEQGLTLAGAIGDPVAQWKFRLMRCEVLLTDRSSIDQALPDLRASIPQRSEFASLAARQKMLEGQAMVSLGRYQEAGPILETAWRLADASHDVETLVGVETLQGARLIREQQWDPAENWLRRALNRAQANHLPYEEAGILVNFGMRRLSLQRFDEALGYFERASSLVNSSSSKLSFVARNNLAICYYRLGEFDRAIQILLPMVEQQQRAGASFYSEAALGATGNTYLLKGDERGAAKYLEGALNVATQIGRKPDIAIWATNLSTLYADLGDWDRAERLNQDAIGIKTAWHDPTLVYNTLNSAKIALGRGHYSEGEHLYQAVLTSSRDIPSALWEAYEELGHSAMLQHQMDLACRRFESAVDVVEQTRSDLSSTEYKLPFLTRLIRLYQQYVDALLAQGDPERALSVADSSRAQVLAERFGSSPARRLPPATLKRIAQQSGSTLISFWLAPQHSHVWVVTADRIRHLDLPPENEIAKLVAEYSDALQHRLADPLRTRIPAGERLYQILVEPLREWLPANARIVIVPDGALTGLNFETLPVSGDTPHYWIEDATIAVAPSIGVLHQVAPAPPTQKLLLIGDPDGTDATYPPLTYASAEMEAVLHHFEPTAQLVLRHKDAVPQAYQAADPGRFTAIHFTAHAVANGESPLDSAVLLSGGKLYAREVMDRKLNAQLVTFSACRGAGSRTYGGEGLVGFAWAFLHAGARNVIAGLWDVSDQSTADLMDVTYRELEAGKKPQDALRIAKLALIRSAGNFRKPYYWGPFQVYTVAP